MAGVYSNATLTIAASRSADCDDGFLSDRNVAPWVSGCFEDADGSFELMFLESAPDLGKEREWLVAHGRSPVSLPIVEYFSEKIS
jgi:hypothetical protein